MPRLAGLLATFLALGGAAACAQDPPPRVQYHRQQTFQLPFRVERGALGAIADPTSVQLHVSTDAGRTWKLYATARPEDRVFPVRVAADGEYQFAVRSVTPTGGLRPDRPLTPELRVIVDTRPPQVDLTASPTTDGQIRVRLQLSDERLDTTTLRLQYQIEGSAEPWQTALVTLPSPSAEGAPVSGDASFKPQLPVNRALVRVRLEVADLAGNVGSSQMSVDWAGAPSAPPPQPVAAAAPTTRNVWPAETATQPLGAGPAAPPPQPATAPSTAGTAPPQPLVERPVAPPVSAQITIQPQPLEAAIAEGEQPFLVNARRFELDYELQSVGPSGVSRVDIYVTPDSGKSWSLAGHDDDLQSPYVATVEREGYYGFRILVVGGNGLQTPPPQPGDAPEITIGVDLTAPQARFTGATQGASAEGPTLQIEWEASDPRPDPRPVTLSWAPQRSGPWSVIAAGLENTGHYVWLLDPAVPERVYLRMEVRDEAGNVQTVEPTEPLALDRSAPQGRIRAVRPAR